MATDKQIQANRENAQLSTGPTTEAGKEAVAQNRTQHGLTGNFIFLSKDDREEFNEMRRNLVADLTVTSPTEFELIDRMAESLWRSRRAVELQDECMDTLAFKDESLHPETRKNLELYLRYQASHDRAYQRYAAELRKLQADLKKAEIGFDSQTRREVLDARAEAQETRRGKNEVRRQEQHENAVQLQKARIEHQQLLNRKLACEVSESERAINAQGDESPLSVLETEKDCVNELLAA